MFRENNSSTSTKRRRLRSELNFIHNLSHNVSSYSAIAVHDTPPISNVSVPYEFNNIDCISSKDTTTYSTRICSNECSISNETNVNSEQHDFESFSPDKSDNDSDSSDENDIYIIEEPPITHALIK